VLDCMVSSAHLYARIQTRNFRTNGYVSHVHKPKGMMHIRWLLGLCTCEHAKCAAYTHATSDNPSRPWSRHEASDGLTPGSFAYGYDGQSMPASTQEKLDKVRPASPDSRMSSGSETSKI
jgi:hypothetical protein